MKARKRLTREESKELTRMRLIDAAEALFVRKGFDGTSVEEISGMAGYTRGAFYSNFTDKDQVFLAVIDRRHRQALEEIVQRTSEPAEPNAAFREWFSEQWRRRDLVALRMEFSRRAFLDQSARKHRAELRRRELETYCASVSRYLGSTDGAPRTRPEIVALVLLAAVTGLGLLALDTDSEWEHMYTDAAILAFDRMTTFQLSQLGQLQC